MTPLMTRLRFVAPAIAAAALLLVPAIAAAHAEYEASSPADGETIVGAPGGNLINARYSERLDPDGSSLTLVDQNGVTIASGGVTAPADYPFEMWIEDLPNLEPGVYTVRSTSKSAEDGDIERMSWSFTIIAPSGTPTEVPAAICTDQCDPGSPIGSAGSTSTSTPETSPLPTAAPTPAPTDQTSAGGEVILPIIVGLAVVLIAAGLLLSRRGRPSGGV